MILHKLYHTKIVQSITWDFPLIWFNPRETAQLEICKKNHNFFELQLSSVITNKSNIKPRNTLSCLDQYTPVNMANPHPTPQHPV